MAVTQISSGAWRPQVRRRGVHWNWGANETLLGQASICQVKPCQHFLPLPDHTVKDALTRRALITFAVAVLLLLQTAVTTMFSEVDVFYNDTKERNAWRSTHARDGICAGATLVNFCVRIVTAK